MVAGCSLFLSIPFIVHAILSWGFCRAGFLGSVLLFQSIADWGFARERVEAFRGRLCGETMGSLEQLWERVEGDPLAPLPPGSGGGG